TEFLKKYDKVWYFYKHIEPFIKDNALIKTEKEILNGFLDKAEELSPKSYLQICQTILEKELYPKLHKYAKRNSLKFVYDNLADIGNNFLYPKLYFYKESWNEHFYIILQFNLEDFFNSGRDMKYIYGIWTWNWLKSEYITEYKKLKNLYKSLNKQLKLEKYSTVQYLQTPLKTKRQTLLNTNFFKTINNKPDKFLGDIKKTIEEILTALSEKGL
ncbi:MAG: hypothetical protein IIX47_01735, partial [Spirochaetaceae bacterium]|nr:hypothetical protein [Spirochaetaceae bacterium]